MTRLRYLAVLAALVPLLEPARAAQSAKPTFDFSPLEETVRQEMQKAQAPGAAIAIVLGDRVVYSRGFGVASVETNEPVHPDMLFRLGSTTKMFTATALVSLAEKGVIDLHKPIGTYVKGLDPKIAAVTAHQFLSHTSGFIDEAPMFGSSDESALAKEVRSWTDTRFFTEPGRIYSYSNPGFWMAGFLIETLSGKSYADQMDASVFKPLGMTRTTLRPLVAMTYPLAQGHDATPQGPKVVRPAANNAASWPAGSIFSNVSDLSRFVIAFVNGGKLENQQVLSPTLIATLSAPHAKIPGSDASYGYGLELARYRGMDVVRHGGSRSGYGSTIRMVPQHRFGVIVLANRTGAGFGDTAEKAMEIALSLPSPHPTAERRPVALTAAEMDAYVGVYSQGPRAVHIVSHDGQVFLEQQGREAPLLKIADNELQSANGLRIVLVRSSSGTIEYLHMGGRSWKKTS